MHRALELAQNGLGNVSPNPLVGCIIVHNDMIIGEGFHQKYGQPHAEVNAINSVINKNLLSESTLYVTLEPCSHFGKTPPCADIIIKYKIPKVIICNTDPFEKVNGAGVKRLRDSGIEIETGILSDKGLALNKRFFTSILKNRPFVILKWAQTIDGFIARENFDSKWISNKTSRKFSHKLRAEEDAILVGYNTVKHDNPNLSCRDWEGKNPIRVVIDKKLSLNQDLHFFDKSIPAICYNSIKNEAISNLEFIKIDFNLLEENILNNLHNKDIQSVIIEGGSKTIQKFINQNLWDEAYVFVGEEEFVIGINAPKIEKEPSDIKELLNNQLKIYKNV